MPNVAFFIKQTIQLTILYKKNTKQSFKSRLRWTVSDQPEKLDPDLFLPKSVAESVLIYLYLFQKKTPKYR